MSETPKPWGLHIWRGYDGKLCVSVTASGISITEAYRMLLDVEQKLDAAVSDENKRAAERKERTP